MNAGLGRQLAVLAELVDSFELAALAPAVRACQGLAGDAPLDVAVLGQFKSGKSSLLNAVLGQQLFPIGVLPVTAVITRAAAGPELRVRVTDLDGAMAEIAPDRIADFVSEAANPGNRRQVAVVDVFTPAMADWPAVRLVDTPGLGSVLAHTAATRTWLPNVAVALVTISADRPLAEEDRRLLAEARATAPQVIVILTKVDLLTDAECAEVADYLDRALRQQFEAAIPILPFSTRAHPDQWVSRLRDTILRPLAGNAASERQAALALKLTAAARACQGYLSVGLQAAERAEADRDRVRAAVLDEQVALAVIRDELRLARGAAAAGIRPAFQELFLAHRDELDQRLTQALAAELRSWQGNLAQQARRYEAWMAAQLTAELQSLSHAAEPRARELLRTAEVRFRRVIEAFRDRLTRNIRETTGLAVAPVAWEPQPPVLRSIPVALSATFMTHWDLLWWLLPMSLVGGLFRRHVLRRVPWEVEKNLTRLASDWTAAVDAAVADLGGQASTWVAVELATLERLLGPPAAAADRFRDALRRLEDTGLLQSS